MSLTVENKERVSQSNNVKKSVATQPNNVSIHTTAKKSSKENPDIECLKHCIEICKKDKMKLVQKLKTGNFTELDKQFATEAKHPIAMGIGYTGMAISGVGMSVAILGFMEPHALFGGLVAAGIGAAIAGVAKGIIVNGDVKNTTDKDIRNYIQSEINKIDEKIADYKEDIRKLEAE